MENGRTDPGASAANVATLSGSYRAAVRAARGHLPARYAVSTKWRYPFDRRLSELLREGTAILDVGAGRSPTIPPDRRPAQTTYVGLDVSREELALAPAGSYDEVVAGDLLTPDPALEDRFDLVVSWLLFEHLSDVAAGFELVHRYLRPGGTALIFLAGRNSLPARVNRAVPHAVARWLLERSHRRLPDTVFKAYYDRCTRSDLAALAVGWTSFEIEPFFWTADYVMFSRALLAPVVAYEEWQVRRGRADHASYYLVCARA